MLQRISIPAARCVTLEEAKAHLRVDLDIEDDTIGAYLDAAIDSCADFAGRAFNQCQYRVTADGWRPARGYWSHWPCVIEVPIAPVVVVATVKYRDEDEALQTLDAGDWYPVNTPDGARVMFASDFTAPKLWRKPGAIQVDLEAGYDPPDYSQGLDPELKLPSQAKAAILLTCGHLYANRESVVVGKMPAVLPMAVQHLLSQIRIYR